MEERRYGQPRTDEERRERHYKRFRTRQLPPRGTGLNRMQRDSTKGSPEFTDTEMKQGYRKVK